MIKSTPWAQAARWDPSGRHDHALSRDRYPKLEILRRPGLIVEQLTRACDRFR
jgi:hypothetical protein